MKRLTTVRAFVGAAVLFSLACMPVMAQQGGGGQGGQGRQGRGGQGGGFDPEQMRQRMTERMREQLGVKDDAEWKVLEERIQKVNDARRDVGFGGGMRMMMGRPPGGPQDQAAGGDSQNRRRGFGGEPSVAQQELQQAIEGNAPAETIKVKLAKVRDERKSKQAALEKAQDDLKKVCTVKQEAVLVMMGVLN